MKGETYFEEISAGAISPHMPACKAVIIDLGEAAPVTAQLKELYSAQSYRVYVVQSTISKLQAILERCRGLHVPVIVNCGKEIIDVPNWHPNARYNAAAIIPGSSNSNDNLLAHFAEDPLLESFSAIGFQSYRFNPKLLNQLQQRYFEDMRLGVMRDDITLCEPMLRECNFAFIDMRCVRYSDYPFSNNANPNGMYAEELCTAARYIGMSASIDSVFIYGEENGLTVCNKLIAETIWHICEGIACNILEHPNHKENDESFQKKIVSLGDNGQNISFTTSCNTGRWWMEIPEKDGGNRLVPCSLNDYKMACSGEIPLKWLFFYQKYSL